MIPFVLRVTLGWGLVKLQEKREISRLSEPAARIQIKENLLKSIGEKIFIEEISRKDFLEEFANTLERLINGELIGRNDFRRTLLGRKGVGKTSILTAISDSCRELKMIQYRLLIVILNDQNSSKLTPIKAIINQLPLYLRLLLELEIRYSDMHVTTVAAFLQSHGYYVLGLFDEFQNLFRNSSLEHAKEVALQLSAIADNTNGVFHWILSGSATYLRKIITAQLEAPKDGKLLLFPFYTGLDLNDTKFKFRSIFPFLNKDDFINYLGFIKSNVNEKDYLNLYLSTGGVPRLLSYLATESCCKSPNPDYSLKTKGSFIMSDQDKIKDPTTILFKSIARALDVSDLVSFENEFDVAVKWTTLVPKDTVIQAFSQEYKGEKVNVTALCYDLADRGFIRYLDERYPEMIGFMSPYMFLEVFSGSIRNTIDEAIALRQRTNYRAERFTT